MSTHLFRADIFYDSSKDHTIINEPGTGDFSGFTKHLKKEYRPAYLPITDFQWQMSYVRQLVPRNRQLDKDLVQTCHFYRSQEGGTDRNLILYVPHVANADDMPWYHPKVRQLAFFHERRITPVTEGAGGDVGDKVSVHYCYFPDIAPDERLERTALQLLHKIHKHGQGQEAGYIKRVHHDQIVPQQRFQDTYARLKAKYAKTLITDWVETTDPGKHVFEDLGIAAFLIELWADMYDCAPRASQMSSHQERESSTPDKVKQHFPGFVDIGCGNGLLVNLLIQEGYPGWGFDVRRRKTWRTFPSHIQDKVKEMVLIPDVLLDTDTGAVKAEDDTNLVNDRAFHNGIFEPGTFIVSNHADELTPWTPLIAHMNDSPFIAIPCCSHNLAGARWRAPPSKGVPQVASSKQNGSQTATCTPAAGNNLKSQAAETGSLKAPAAAKNVPSAYASLCDYVSSIAQEVGFVAEKEMLRIPSTRNACILGRRRHTKLKPVNSSSRNGYETASARPYALDEQNLASMTSSTTIGDPTCAEDVRAQRRLEIRKIVKRELNCPVEAVCEDWIKRAEQIAGKKSDGH
ncbi:hypothetical protein MBLNU459_g6147t1 [Dothideomycetes sp. NU459]